ncbi:hypothetical protein C2G38_2050160 [Gigaspora rosea]|uniref:Uncharacterized protein n=1 Tax=Gigaspora rosea TaxID=44941 RepID=A0A397TZT8_9GLOM|nr:hypothetical protein C2G38_2050160 [Gigaspora rosea]
MSLVNFLGELEVSWPNVLNELDQNIPEKKAKKDQVKKDHKEVQNKEFVEKFLTDLRDNQLGPEGGKAIADALCENSTLTYLELCSNSFGRMVNTLRNITYKSSAVIYY